MLINLFLVQCIKIVTPLDLSPGHAVPHANILRRILTANLMNFTDTPEGSLVDYLFNTNETSYKANTDNLDINVLDVENVRKIIAAAKRKYYEDVLKDSRRKKETLKTNPHLIEMAMRQMQQSIYSTRERLQQTSYFRKRLIGDISYKLAILVGSMNQIVLKMDNLYAQMRHFPIKTHFLWYLIIYEKLLAGNVDVTHMVQKIFEFHKEYLKKMQDASKK